MNWMHLFIWTQYQRLHFFSSLIGDESEHIVGGCRCQSCEWAEAVVEGDWLPASALVTHVRARRLDWMGLWDAARRSQSKRSSVVMCRVVSLWDRGGRREQLETPKWFKYCWCGFDAKKKSCLWMSLFLYCNVVHFTFYYIHHRSMPLFCEILQDWPYNVKVLLLNLQFKKKCRIDV